MGRSTSQMFEKKVRKSIKLYYFDYVGTYGGAQQSTSVLFNKLNEKYKEQLNPTVIAINGTSKQFLDSLSVPILYINLKKNFDIFKLRRNRLRGAIALVDYACNVKKLILKDSKEAGRVIIICNSAKALYTLAILRLLGLKFEFIFYSRGEGKGENLNKIAKVIINYQVDRILCVSHQTKNNMLEFVDNEKKFSVTYTSVDFSKLEPFYSEKILEHSNLKILFAGAIIPNKGLKDLIEGISLLSKGKQKRIELYIAGINNSPDVENYVNECDIICKNTISKFHWLGWQDNIPDIISKVDIVCLPSYSEGLPRIIQEAMYMGKLVICTPVGGVPSLVQDGITGLSIDIGSSQSIKIALEKCFESTFIRNIQKNARMYINNKFNLEKQIDLVVDAILYENNKK